MLFGESPFNGKTLAEIKETNEINAIRFPDLATNKVSKDAQNFILELTNSNPKYRPSAEEALENSWLKRLINPSPPIDPFISKTHKVFKSMNTSPDIMECYKNNSIKNQQIFSKPQEHFSGLDTSEDLLIKINIQKDSFVIENSKDKSLSKFIPESNIQKQEESTKSEFV